MNDDPSDNHVCHCESPCPHKEGKAWQCCYCEGMVQGRMVAK